LYGVNVHTGAVMSDKEVVEENLFRGWGWINTDCDYLAQVLLD
jgi:hypothetical protein